DTRNRDFFQTFRKRPCANRRPLARCDRSALTTPNSERLEQGLHRGSRFAVGICRTDFGEDTWVEAGCGAEGACLTILRCRGVVAWRPGVSPRRQTTGEPEEIPGCSRFFFRGRRRGG